MDRNLALELVRVTEAAALASARWMGKGDPDTARGEAVEAMFLAGRSVAIDGAVVIGEGEAEDSPLHEGARIGSGSPPAIEAALDPVEGVNSVSFGRNNALSVMAVAQQGGFFRPPVTRMEKIAVGPEAAGKIDLSAPPLENLVNVADAKRCYVEDLTVCILERERHGDLIEQVREAGARIKLIPDGDLAAAVSTAVKGSGVDVVMGTGGSKAGILAAAALACVRGDMQVRLAPRDHRELEAARRSGKEVDPKRIYRLEELVRESGVMFAATGITNSDLLSGVRFRPGGAITHSVVMRQVSGTVRFIRAEHHFERKPDYA
jgi:fructose-1,6-bisphosphatase II